MHVCLILFPGFPMLALSLAREVLRRANACAGHQLLSCHTRTVTGAPVDCADGTSVAPDRSGWSGVQGIDLVLLIANPAPSHFLPLGLRSFLEEATRAGAMLGGVSAGVGILDRLGVLSEPPTEPRCRMQITNLNQHPAGNSSSFTLDRRRLLVPDSFGLAEALIGWIARAHDPGLALKTAASLGLDHVAHPHATAVRDPDLTRMQAIMAAHLDVPRPLPCIAEDLGLSPKQLRNRCRAALGRTPAQVYTEMRLARADALVQSTALPVGAVARAAGFASPSAFTRSYRAHFGQAPQDRRRQRAPPQA
ncbi:hypothetical protein AVJ23_04875 [Pseudoponticoccus marisrubri]|uniref:HTH araC/xylS-type domain-containing protein n=2 Tax=Pseudoponticoccus marisrubri TaxID=1685382 RepID=A0A0W7WMV8_9RHOB|nr:hypothetical protein AVJ23_04875 [Pseudoponticoccus marisrubri]